jgi:hypothetical protein
MANVRNVIPYVVIAEVIFKLIASIVAEILHRILFILKLLEIVHVKTDFGGMQQMINVKPVILTVKPVLVHQSKIA